MKKLKMSLELSNLGIKTHIWFPLPQRVNGGSKEWLNPTDFKIVTDKKFGNKIAYFYYNEVDKITIMASFPVSDKKSSRASPSDGRSVAIFGIATSSRRDVGAPRNDSNIKQFLHPNRFVQSDDKMIISIAENLTKNYVLDEEKAKKCFDWVVDYLEYANPIRGLYSSVQALTDRKVDCGGFSTLLTALLRTSKIPARCVFGWAVESKFGYHAWVEFFDNKKSLWIPCDPSVAHLGKRTKLDAGLGFINDNRVIFSVGEDLNLVGNDIKWNVPLLQSPIVVSLDKKGIPIKFDERLSWSIA